MVIESELNRLGRKELASRLAGQIRRTEEIAAENTVLSRKLAEAEERYARLNANASEQNGCDLCIERLEDRLRQQSEQFEQMARTAEEGYQARINQLEEMCAALKRRLNERAERFGAAGSLAEAVVGMSGIFEAAQQTADRYLAELQISYGQSEEILKRANAEAERIIREAEAQARLRLDAAAAEIRQNQEDFHRQCEAVIHGHEVLSRVMRGFEDSERD